MSLGAADDGRHGELGDGDDDPARATGRNPEVEEVLGALSLLLNGGGVAQLKTITQRAQPGPRGPRGLRHARCSSQVDSFMGQLDENKADIVDAIESLNRLAVAREEQQRRIDAALDELPSALDSIDRQRADLVKMLKALDRLGDVGVRVIRRPRTPPSTTLRQLDPVLTQLADSGDDFADAFHVFLTYPFVDEVVGRDPQVARNLHMGDYTNLSITLDVDLTGGSPRSRPTLPTRLPPAARPAEDVRRCPTPLPTERRPRRATTASTGCSRARLKACADAAGLG